MRELIARCRTGDASAVEEVVRRLSGWAVGFAESFVGDRHLAQDAAQEAFITALSRLESLRSDESFVPWMRQIIRTHALRIVRRQRDLPLEDVREPGTADVDPLNRIVSDELRAIVTSSVAQLPPAGRETVELFYLGECSVIEVSHLLGIPQGSVKRRLHDARKQLKGILAANGLPDAVRPEIDEQGRPVRRTPIV